jgi:hypothetical protein
LAALERATGKVNVLLARNDKAALIPVDVAVEIADTAPQDTKAINNIAEQSRDALKGRHFAEARALLDALRSEVRIRTFNLPLATYPSALLQAAKLVEDGKNDDAARVLTIALNTLLIVDRAISIPLVAVTDQLRAADDDVKKKRTAGRPRTWPRQHGLAACLGPWTRRRQGGQGFPKADRRSGAQGQRQ